MNSIFGRQIFEEIQKACRGSPFFIFLFIRGSKDEYRISSNKRRGYYYFNVPERSGHYSKAATIQGWLLLNNILVHMR